MFDKTTIFIHQPFYLKLLAYIKRVIRRVSFIKNIKLLKRDSYTWYGLEQADDMSFRWSHPIAKFNIQNLQLLIFCVVDPYGREIIITTKGVNKIIKLVPGKIYKIIVNVHDANEILIQTNPLKPENDSRSLGIKFLYVYAHNGLILI